MSAPATATTWQWPADVVELAVRHQLDPYLDPMLAATRQVFPTARSLRVFREDDPELRDVTFIVFEVEVPRADVPNSVQAYRRWTDQLLRICPYPQQCLFTLTLIPVNS